MEKKKKEKNIFYNKVKFIDIKIWESLTVLLNEKDAWEHGIMEVDKVAIVLKDWEEIVVNVDLTTRLVGIGEVWILKDVREKYSIDVWDVVGIYFTRRSNLAIEAIRKKMRWEDINYDEIFAIIKNISENKLQVFLMKQVMKKCI